MVYCFVLIEKRKAKPSTKKIEKNGKEKKRKKKKAKISKERKRKRRRVA